MGVLTFKLKRIERSHLKLTEVSLVPRGYVQAVNPRRRPRSLPSINPRAFSTEFAPAM
jgi:hypothetical protein